MDAIATLLVLTGTLAVLVSFVSVLWPLKRIGLPTRKRSALRAFQCLQTRAG